MPIHSMRYAKKPCVVASFGVDDLTPPTAAVTALTVVTPPPDWVPLEGGRIFREGGRFLAVRGRVCMTESTRHSTTPEARTLRSPPFDLGAIFRVTPNHKIAISKKYRSEFSPTPRAPTCRGGGGG